MPTNIYKMKYVIENNFSFIFNKKVNNQNHYQKNEFIS